MISDETAKYLWDARRAAARILRFTSGRSFDDYLVDDMLRSAVERQFTIIGEAFACVRRTDAAVAETIPDISEIIGFRNVLIHGYGTVDNEQVWHILHTELPALWTTLDQILRELDA